MKMKLAIILFLITLVFSFRNLKTLNNKTNKTNNSNPNKPQDKNKTQNNTSHDMTPPTKFNFKIKKDQNGFRTFNGIKINNTELNSVILFQYPHILVKQSNKSYKGNIKNQKEIKKENKDYYKDGKKYIISSSFETKDYFFFKNKKQQFNFYTNKQDILKLDNTSVLKENQFILGMGYSEKSLLKQLNEDYHKDNNKNNKIYPSIGIKNEEIFIGYNFSEFNQNKSLTLNCTLPDNKKNFICENCFRGIIFDSEEKVKDNETYFLNEKNLSVSLAENNKYHIL